MSGFKPLANVHLHHNCRTSYFLLLLLFTSNPKALFSFFGGFSWENKQLAFLQVHEKCVCRKFSSKCDHLYGNLFNSFANEHFLLPLWNLKWRLHSVYVHCEKMMHVPSTGKSTFRSRFLLNKILLCHKLDFAKNVVYQFNKNLSKKNFGMIIGF